MTPHPQTSKGDKNRARGLLYLPLAFLLLVLTVVVAACSEADAPPDPALETTHYRKLAQEVYKLAREKDFSALERPPRVRYSLVRLGQALMFDKVLSGNEDISCMTCHLPSLGLGDARHLSIGQGGSGLGENRTHPETIFEPRHAPPLFNLHTLDHLFWDGRVEVAKEDGKEVFKTPAGDQLTEEMTDVFEFGAVSALGLFPVENRLEMRSVGFKENELTAVPDGEFQGVWSALMARLGEIPQYRRMFERAYQ